MMAWMEHGFQLLKTFAHSMEDKTQQHLGALGIIGETSPLNWLVVTGII